MADGITPKPREHNPSIQDHVSVVQIAAQKLASAKLARPASSKYDFIKVKVWLDNSQHYYVLSRFLISRTLTSVRIPQIKAVRIALDLKKFLVDSGHLDINQSQLEHVLFAIMQQHGYDAVYTRRYKTLTRFHMTRRPLLVLVCGAPCSGKSTLAQKLAARMNLPNVLQTDTIYELLQSGTDPPLAQQPLWQRKDLTTPRLLLQEFAREARIVRRGLEGDLIKTLRDGKSIVIEGQHIDPSMYLQEFRSAAPRQPYATTHTDHETIHKNNDEHKHKNNHDECIHNSNDEHTNKNDDINNNNSNPSAVTHPTPHPSTTRKHMHAALHTRRRSRDDSSIPHHPPHDVDGLLEHLVSAASGRTREHLVSATSNSVVGSNREHSVQGGGTVMLRLSELLGGGVGGVGGAHRTTHTGVVGRGGREGVDQLVDQWHARRNIYRTNSDSQLLQSLRARLPCNRDDDDDADDVLDDDHVDQHDDQRHTSLQRTSVHSDLVPVPVPAVEAVHMLEPHAMDPINSPTKGVPSQSQSHHHTVINPSQHIANNSAGPIFVPMVIAMQHEDQSTLLEDWVARRWPQAEGDAHAQASHAVQVLADHFAAYGGVGVPVFTVSLRTFGEVLESMHDYLLACVEFACHDAYDG